MKLFVNNCKWLQKPLYLGHLLVNNVLKNLCRRQNQLCEIHCLVLENMWFYNFEEKSLIHQGK